MRELLRVVVLAGTALLLVAALLPLLDPVSPLGPKHDAGYILHLSFLALVLLVPRRPRTEVLRETGLPDDARPFRSFLAGAAAGITSLVLYHALLMALGEETFRIRTDKGHPLLYALKYIPAGLALVLILEEPLFRGVILTRMRRDLPALPAIALSAAVFAVAHLFAIPKGVTLEDRGFHRGLAAARAMAGGLGDVLTRPRTVIGLFLGGCVLGLVRVRTGSIYAAMGVHFGWFWVPKADNVLIRELDRLPEALVGSSLYYDGCLAWIFLVLSAPILSAILRRKGSRPRG